MGEDKNKDKNVPTQKIVNICKRLDDIDPNAIRNLVITKGGFVEVRPKGPMIITLPTKDIPEAGEELKSGVTTTKKIPIELLIQIMSFFHEVYIEHGTEAGAVIMYNIKDEKYWVHVPNLDVAGTRASWDREYVVDYPEDIPVVEFHSHPWSSDPSPSGIDDTDESGSFGLFGIIGNLESNIFLRAANRGETVKIPLYDVFERSFPSEWMNKVEVASKTGSWSGAYDWFKSEDLDSFGSYFGGGFPSLKSKSKDKCGLPKKKKIKDDDVFDDTAQKTLADLSNELGGYVGDSLESSMILLAEELVNEIMTSTDPDSKVTDIEHILEKWRKDEFQETGS